MGIYSRVYRVQRRREALALGKREGSIVEALRDLPGGVGVALEAYYAGDEFTTFVCF